MSPSPHPRAAHSGEFTCAVRGVDLCLETFGDRRDRPVLLIGAPTMLTWPEIWCTELAADRYVIRYDLRDAGGSTRIDPNAPSYTLRDLVEDGAALLDTLSLPATHIVGYGVAGFIAQLLALDHPDRVATLTLIATRPVAPGPADDDLPEHDPALMEHLFGAPAPDWSDRDAALEYMVDHGAQFAGSAGYDRAAAYEQAAATYDRTAAHTGGLAPEVVHPMDLMATSFAALDATPRWRERLAELTTPTLVVHGVDDPFFPVGNARALAAEIPGAVLLELPGTGQELPDRVRRTVLDALRSHTAG